MLLFRRGRALKIIEEGLRWKAAGPVGMPGRVRFRPEGVFVNVPVFDGPDQFSLYIHALSSESEHVLGFVRPAWVQLRGEGIGSLPMSQVKAIAKAACPDAGSAGLEINPEALEPGAIAGYRSIAMERLCFVIDTPYAQIDDPIRKARALGAYTSAEVRLGAKLAGKAFLQIVEKALSAAPDQLSVSDARNHGAFGAELLEKAGEMCLAAGMTRTSAWVWARGGESFDCLGILLSGRSANLGPDAFTCRPQAYANPDLRRWLQTRLSGDFEVIRPEGRLEQWLALAAGLYFMELKRDSLDCKMHRHVSALERMGVIDRKGRPGNAQAMEFCHRAARAARQVVLGGADTEWLAEAHGSEALAIRARG